MGIEFQTDVKTDYVLFKCHGVYENVEIASLIERIFDFVEDKDLRGALVDIRQLGGDPTTMDRHDIGVKFAELQLERESRVVVAIVGLPPIVTAEKFAEVVGTNRGAVWKVFSDMVEATLWLKVEVSRLEVL